MPKCSSCNKETDTLLPCTWDEDLEGVGECCEFHIDDCLYAPLELVCQEEVLIFMQAKTVREVVRLVAEHRSVCPKCSVFGMPRLPVSRPGRGEAGRGTGTRPGEWKKAA
jgi:hypothetical protein